MFKRHTVAGPHGPVKLPRGVSVEDGTYAIKDGLLLNRRCDRLQAAIENGVVPATPDAVPDACEQAGG